MKQVFLIAAVVWFIGCKKEDASAITKENLAGSYATESVMIQVGSNLQDITKALPVCKQDDIQVLNADYSYTYRDAGVTCSNTETHAIYWDLQSGNTIVIDQNPMHIESFDGHRLQLRDSSQY